MMNISVVGLPTNPRYAKRDRKLKRTTTIQLHTIPLRSPPIKKETGGMRNSQKIVGFDSWRKSVNIIRMLQNNATKTVAESWRELFFCHQRKKLPPIMPKIWAMSGISRCLKVISNTNQMIATTIESTIVKFITTARCWYSKSSGDLIAMSLRIRFFILRNVSENIWDNDWSIISIIGRLYPQVNVSTTLSDDQL